MIGENGSTYHEGAVTSESRKTTQKTSSICCARMSVYRQAAWLTDFAGCDPELEASRWPLRGQLMLLAATLCCTNGHNTMPRYKMGRRKHGAVL